ncbi:hypothetical protein [Dyadobacter psychrotolerans]|uniref:Uncharacterized protein n=1 Tax=Dyadobacter psychrotolerans TaxID=2541721 RepID=A0A4R5DGK8_9BACT|nr:hypothetical protein [Dyadobacter psychrotolerans]TDE09553.1 hypothetical protein E0F88_30145 [Dyadobacter psychrotolerans]
MEALFEKTKSEILLKWPNHELKEIYHTDDQNGQTMSLIINCEPPKGVQMSYYKNSTFELLILPQIITDNYQNIRKHYSLSSRGRHFHLKGGKCYVFYQGYEYNEIFGRNILNRNSAYHRFKSIDKAVDLLIHELENG